MKGRKQGARLDKKCPTGNLLDAARDSKAVEFSGPERLEDQQIERTLEEACLFGVHFPCPIDRLYEYVRAPTECQ
jgi:hypothetical protein